jgi:hypothetical protein
MPFSGNSWQQLAVGLFAVARRSRHCYAIMWRTGTKARDGPRTCFDQNERASFHCEAFLEQFLRQFGSLLCKRD